MCPSRCSYENLLGLSMPTAMTSNQMVLLNNLVSTSNWNTILTYLNKMIVLVCSSLKDSGHLEHNNKPGLSMFKWLYVTSSATYEAWEGTLQIMVVDGTFLKDQIFDQNILLAVYHLWQEQQSDSVVLCSCDIQNRSQLGVIQTSAGARLSSTICPCCRLLKWDWKPTVPR